MAVTKYYLIQHRNKHNTHLVTYVHNYICMYSQQLSPIYIIIVVWQETLHSGNMFLNKCVICICICMYIHKTP